MTIWKAWTFRTRALVVLNAALVTLLATQWFGHRSLEDRLRDVAVPKVTVTPPVSNPAVHASNLSLVRESAVFHTSRHYIPPPDPNQSVKPPPPSLQWVAVMLLPQSKSIAYAKPVGGGAPLKLRLGENVAGWTVARIERQRVILEQNGELFEITPPSASSSNPKLGMTTP